MQLFSVELIDYADRLSNGAKMPRVGWKDLADFPVVIPTELVATEYKKVVEPLLARMKANVHEAKTLATLRDTLLPRLISGALRLGAVA
jgi:type I restriction enzyme S subunit